MYFSYLIFVNIFVKKFHLGFLIKKACQIRKKLYNKNMTEFNSINNLNFQKIAPNKAGLVQNSQVQNNSTPQQNQNLPTNQNFINQNQTINPSLMYDMQIAKMDNEVVLKYLQNLLNLPNSIDKFVNQLNSKNIDPKMLQILVENMINTKALAQLLNQNSTEAISKLLQTISNSLKSGVSDISQLKEILSVLNAIQASTNLNSNTLKEILLLYIPLSIPVFDKEIETETVNKEEETKIQNSTLSLMIQTINFGNALCCLNQENNDLLIELYIESSFPKENFIKIITTLSKEASINSFIDIKPKKTQEKEKTIETKEVEKIKFIKKKVNEIKDVPNYIYELHWPIYAIYFIMHFAQARALFKSLSFCAENEYRLFFDPKEYEFYHNTILQFKEFLNKGKELFKGLEKKFEYELVDPNYYMSHNKLLMEPLKKPIQRDEFYKCLDNKKFKDNILNCIKENKIKFLTKNILYKIKLFKVMKNIKYKIK